MSDSNPLRKPAGFPSRGDPSAFLNREFNQNQAAVQPQPPPFPVAERIKEEKSRKENITYKHNPRNFLLLKKLSHRLEIPIGDLLDEALEARFPEWRVKAAALPPDEF
jgi:hypothetical protein